MFNQIDILSSCEIEHSSLFAQQFVLVSFFLSLHFVSVSESVCVLKLLLHRCKTFFTHFILEYWINAKQCNNMMWTKVNLKFLFFLKKVYRLYACSFIHSHGENAPNKKQHSVILGSVISMRWKCLKFHAHSRRFHSKNGANYLYLLQNKIKNSCNIKWMYQRLSNTLTSRFFSCQCNHNNFYRV